jgi:hypothetical protein
LNIVSTLFNGGGERESSWLHGISKNWQQIATAALECKLCNHLEHIVVIELKISSMAVNKVVESSTVKEHVQIDGPIDSINVMIVLSFLI